MLGTALSVALLLGPMCSSGPAAQEPSGGAGGEGIPSRRLFLRGALDLEAGFEDQRFEDGSSRRERGREVELELGVGARLTQHVGGQLFVLYEKEEGKEETEVDQAYLEADLGWWAVRLGRQYLPFGVFPSHFVTYSLTDELGEIRETAALLVLKKGPLGAALFVFDGEAAPKHGPDRPDWGAAVVIGRSRGAGAGVGFVSDLADSDELQEDVPRWSRRVPGVSAHAVLKRGRWEFLADGVAALRAFSSEDRDENDDGDGDRPAAWNLEAARELGPRWEAAARIGGSREFEDEPRAQAGVALAWKPWKPLTLSVEYQRKEFAPAFADGLVRAHELVFGLEAKFGTTLETADPLTPARRRPRRLR